MLHKADLIEQKQRLRRWDKVNNEAFLQEIGSVVPGEALIYLRTNLETGEYYVGQATTNESRDEVKRQIEHDTRHGVNFNYRVLWEGPNNQLTQLSRLGGRARTTTVDLVEQFFIDAYQPKLSNRSNSVNATVWREAVRLGLVRSSLALGTVAADYSAPLRPNVTQPGQFRSSGRSRRPAPIRLPVRAK